MGMCFPFNAPIQFGNCHLRTVSCSYIISTLLSCLVNEGILKELNISPQTFVNTKLVHQTNDSPVARKCNDTASFSSRLHCILMFAFFSVFQNQLSEQVSER